MVCEDIFRADRTKTIYQSETSTIDGETGEILNQQRTTVKKVSSEPEYIKIYYKTMLAFHNVDDIPLNFILSVSQHLTWANGKQMSFIVNKSTRNAVMEDCGIKATRFQTILKKCVDYGIFFKSDCKGEYFVNPFIIAKGKWERIKELRTEFCFTDGKWMRTLNLEDLEEHGTE